MDLSVSQAFFAGVIVGLVVGAALWFAERIEDKQDLAHYRAVFSNIFDFSSDALFPVKKRGGAHLEMVEPMAHERIELPPLPEFLRDHPVGPDHVDLDAAFKDWGGR